MWPYTCTAILARRLSWDSIFGKKSKKQVKRDILEENRRKGRAAEDTVRFQYEIQGWQVEKTNKGPDFRMKRPNYFTGKTEYKKVEVKSGNAHLSEYQKKVRKKSGFSVERVDDNPFGVW